MTKPKPLLSRPEIIGLCKRFLKEDKYDGKLDPIALGKAIKKYPNRRFWLGYTLNFRLNSCFWFLGKDGRDQLSRDWATFSLDIPPQPEYTLEDVKQGEDIIIERKPRTLGELLG